MFMLIWGRCADASTVQFEKLWPAGVEQSRPDLAAWKDDLQRLRVGGHLRLVRSRDYALRFRHAAGLEVDDGNPVRLDQEPVDRPRNYDAVRQGRGKRRFRKRAFAEQSGKTGVREHFADSVGDLLSGC